MSPGTASANTRRWSRPAVCALPTRCAWCASAGSICRKQCRRAWAPWRRPETAGRKAGRNSGGGRAGRSCQRGESKLAGSGRHRGTCRGGGARHGTGQGGGRKACRAASGERAVPLRADAPAQQRLERRIWTPSDFSDLAMPLVNNWQARKFARRGSARGAVRAGSQSGALGRFDPLSRLARCHALRSRWGRAAC